ncbi:DUF294 nucleotidyltransferase-like domain-containing protein [Aquibacillus albus]|uniref:CBS domain-containing protein n=1 Tax=Aquibacillus albus TaxID=1168171 RepID=A0ABS2MZ89_9BACI|nr:DUF294 nucleotidyltransferase-like domain-containing protein [Aquibacillus albus]MBM7571220.1 CBS domain-containing protein [Aquibacillus albus]
MKKQVLNKATVDSKRIDSNLNSYKELKIRRSEQIRNVATDHQKLNEFHDDVMKRTFQLAIKKVQSEWGDPPAPFAFFLMGSAGRFEQSIWSDQDHGIIYEGDKECEPYFLTLGEEVKNGLFEVGYELCDGNVMASNPMWCLSLKDWKKQVSDWLGEESWQSLRHFLTFFDSRVLSGKKLLLDCVKKSALSILDQEPRLYMRLIDNVDFIKKGIGVFGQLLPETYGEKSGSIPLKQTAFFPYVNSLRLLALKEKIYEPSTLSRFKKLSTPYDSIKQFEHDFSNLLSVRLHLRKNARDYHEVHLIPIQELTREEKQELKVIIKRGNKLFSETKKIIEKECSTWS